MSYESNKEQHNGNLSDWTVLDEAEQLLQDLKEHIAGEVDVVDGDYGQPAPNKAMRLTQRIDEVIDELYRAGKRVQVENECRERGAQ